MTRRDRLRPIAMTLLIGAAVIVGGALARIPLQTGPTHERERTPNTHSVTERFSNATMAGLRELVRVSVRGLAHEFAKPTFVRGR